MTRIFFKFLFSALIIFFTTLNSYASSTSNEEYILSGDEYNAYAKELSEEGVLRPTPRSSIPETTTIIRFDNLLLLKQSKQLPDWVKSETLEEHGLSLSSSDSELENYFLDETIAFDPAMISLAMSKGAEFATKEIGGNAQARGLCSKKVRRKTKSFEFIKSFSKDVYDFNIKGDYVINGEVKYEKRSRCGFPYKYSYKGVNIKFSLGVDDNELDTIKLSYAYNDTLLKKNLANFSYDWDVMAGPIPIRGEHDFNLDFLIDFFFGVEVELSNKYLLDGGLSFELICSKSVCEQKNTLSDMNIKEVMSSTSPSSVAVTATLTPKIEFTNDNTFKVIYVKTLEIDATVGIGFPITHYQYIGNTCDLNDNTPSNGSLLYVDIVLYGSIEIDPVFHSGKTIPIDFGKLYKKSIDVDEKLADIFNYGKEARLVYKNLYFKAFNSQNFLKPIVNVNKYQSDLSATLSIPNCLPNDLKSRGATYSIDWGKGGNLETITTDSGNTEVSHVFINAMENNDVKFKLEKIGDAKVSVDNESIYTYLNQEWLELKNQEGIPYWYILPSINLILLN